MNVNTKHPDFDPAMELLCLLPMLPKSAPISLICLDLGLKKQNAVGKLVQRLNDRGIAVSIKNEGYDRGRCVGVHRKSWAFARLAASEYYAEVYEKNSTAL